MKRLKLFALFPFFVLFFGLSLQAQQDRPQEGLREFEAGIFALKNATIVPQPGELIQNGILIIRDGKIDAIGTGINIPAEAVIVDLKGNWVFPGLIDAWSHYGQADPKANPQSNKPQYERSNPGPLHWNEAIKPEYISMEDFNPEEKDAEVLRKNGFATVHSTPKDGIFRGRSAWVSLSGEKENSILDPHSGSCLSFRKGVSRQQYPSSLMGIIALMRQTFMDAKWYHSARNVTGSGVLRPDYNRSFDVLASELSDKTPFFIDSEDWQSTLRAAKIAEEAKVPFIYKMKGDAYNHLDAFSKMRLIIPLEFPQAYDFADFTDARNISLEKLRAWQQAPQNPAMLAASKIDFAITTAGIKSDEFWSSLQKAIKNGLSPKDALHALTLAPAKMLGVEDEAGSLEPGKRADLFICSGNPFTHEGETIYETWVGGKRFIDEPVPALEMNATYALTLPSGQYKLILEGKKHQIVNKGDTLKAKFETEGNTLLISFGEEAQYIRLKGMVSGLEMQGYGVDYQENRFYWTGKKIQSGGEEDKSKRELKPVDTDKIARITYPNMAWGNPQIPEKGTFLLQNATVWTNTLEGIRTETDVLVRNGKVAKVGKNLSATGATVIDATGKHVTPGIIDEHSHIAISRGVNEGTHNITAEVRIGDVVRSDDINIYRQLSGGTTAAQLLHGSANPIGGQSALIKLRWGFTPEEMKIEDAAPFIKFALGENVKQSNWGSDNTSRYPQTRAGVEQLMKDGFRAALDYRAHWKKWESGQRKGLVQPRRDLQLEALLEIIDRERFITCHSYQQGEIMMLMRLAESFDFRINTFTHVLEGYKIADKLAAHGASGSTFSDWWAYKYEVIDAVPHNAAVMHKAGVNVCINSDDAEMGRRLNQEAAKAVKYGGVSEEEALKMVTLNPAIALHLGNRMGRIQAGMDGDIVLWSAHPLSIYAQAEKTFVDGRLLFNREQENARFQAIQNERLAIMQAMMEEKSGKKPAAEEPDAEEKHYHCDTIGE